MRVLELGSYVSVAYAGMILAEQGHHVAKWISPENPDPIEGLKRGDELWAWINHGKLVTRCHARLIAGELAHGHYEGVIDNIRESTWKAWGVNPTALAAHAGVPWVSMQDDFGRRSFDAVAQARAWGDHLGYLPAYLGDTTFGLWAAFKLLTAAPGRHVLHQAACLAKLIEGELVVEMARDGVNPPWDAPGTYGAKDDGVAVIFRDETIAEPFHDGTWRRENLRHVDGRYVV